MSTILSQLKPLKIGDLTAKLPIIQGGMGVGISLSSLAGAVAGAGGIGIISTAQIGFREPDFAEHPQEANLRAIGSELQKARAIAKGGIVGFNIMVATKNYAEYVKTSPPAVHPDLLVVFLSCFIFYPHFLFFPCHSTSFSCLSLFSSLLLSQLLVCTIPSSTQEPSALTKFPSGVCVFRYKRPLIPSDFS